MIAIKNLKFHYPDREFTLNIPELNIDSGSTTAVIGPSGTGKTTLLNLMAGYFVPQKGHVHINNTTLSELNKKERRAFRIQNIGLVFQEFELMEYLNVMDNILLPYRISPALKLDENVRNRAVELANTMQINDKLQRNINRLSQGERQRVAICRALLPEPALLLCDEPTGNLDPENKQMVMEFLIREVKQRQTTLVVVTHDHQLLSHFEHKVDFAMYTKQNKDQLINEGGQV